MAEWSERLDRIEQNLEKQGGFLAEMHEMMRQHAAMIIDGEMRHQAAMQDHEKWIKAAEKRHEESMKAAAERHEESVREREAWNAAHSAKLDYIETLMERQVLAAEKHHDEFAAEHNKFLASQVVLSGDVQKMSTELRKLIQKLDGLAGRFNGAGPG